MKIPFTIRSSESRLIFIHIEKTYYTLASITVSPLSRLVTTGLRILPRYFVLALVQVFKNVEKATVVAEEYV